MKHQVVNCETDEVEIRDFTSDEVAATKKANEEREAREGERQARRAALQRKLGLTDEEMELLRG